MIKLQVQFFEVNRNIICLKRQTKKLDMLSIYLLYFITPFVFRIVCIFTS